MAGEASTTLRDHRVLVQPRLGVERGRARIASPGTKQTTISGVVVNADQ